MRSFTEDALSLSEASKIIPGRPSAYTLRRWASKGVRGGLKLETFRVGGQLFTNRQMINAFIAAQNSDASAPRRQACAEQELSELGI